MSSSNHWWTMFLDFIERLQQQTNRGKLIRILASFVLTLALLRRITRMSSTTNNNALGNVDGGTTGNVVATSSAATNALAPAQPPAWKPYSTFLSDGTLTVASHAV